MIELTIKKNDDQRRLDKFLCKTFNKVPKSKIFRLLRQREIKVNDKAIKNGDFKVTIGDKVKVFGLDMKMQNKERDIIPEIEVTFRVVFEDKNVLIVNKPANLVVHGPIDDTLDNQVKRYLYDRKEYDPKKENAFKVSHCNRIDKWSQGIVVYGKNLVTLRTLNEAFQDRDAIDKWYLTHVTKPVQQGMVKGFIYHDEPQKLMVFTFTKPKHNQAKEAITEVVSCKKITENKFLLNIKIITGRKHQIRAMLRALQNPIIGDIKYSSRLSSKRFYLESAKIRFNKVGAPLEYLNKRFFKLEG